MLDRVDKHIFVGLPPYKPRILIPLAVPRAQSISLGLYSPGSIHGKLFKWFGQVAARTGLIKTLGQFIASPVETFNSTEAIRPILTDKVVENLRCAWEEAIGNRPVYVAFSLGTPNDYRKVTSIVFDGRGKPLAVAKVGSTRRASRLISNERKALEKMSSIRLKGTDIPDLLGHGETGQVEWLLQSALLDGVQSPSSLRREHISFVSELTIATRKVMALESWDVWPYIRDMLNGSSLQIKTDFESERSFIEGLHNRFRALDSVDLGRPWQFSAAHGDFAPWNMRFGNGRILLFDWEYYLPLAPAGWDILYFIVRVENLVKKRSLKQIWAAFEEGEFHKSIMLFENRTGWRIQDRRFLAMSVIIAIALDIIPKWICSK